MIMIYVLIYFLIINLITFIVRGVDKRKAVKQKWRISEKTLLILTLMGGFIGAIIGMEVFRHKTIKSKFLYCFRGAVAVWLIILGIIFYLYLKS